VALLNLLKAFRRDPPDLIPAYQCRNEILPTLRKRVEERGYTYGKTGEKQLQIKGLRVVFGGIVAVNDVDIDVKKGEIHAIIGPNGAGKTCVLNAINGIYKAQSGEIIFEKKNILGMKPHDVAIEEGIGRTFQRLALFSTMSVIDNLMVTRHRFLKSGVFGCGLYLGRANRDEILNQRIVEEIIEFLEIEHVRHELAGELGYGLQKRVEIGRALALEPRLLLLDESVSGMNLEEKEDVARFIMDIRDELGITMVIIEHEMDMVMELADRITVMNFGVKIAEGSPEEIANNPEVIKAYLGAEKSGDENG
jgi:branched-chain amino acid transport system ATP-binding protein